MWQMQFAFRLSYWLQHISFPLDPKQYIILHTIRPTYPSFTSITFHNFPGISSMLEC
jgi:hypothetical protein